ncbi:MAG TPA: hypothetical protein VGB53_08780 [Rubricoccaceae bacterium]|jgi:hypothetical protein
MPRLAVLAALFALPLVGCTTTRIVEATDTAALARVQSRVAGREADITLVSGDLYRGRIAFLRLDSTAWEEEAGVFAVPTDDVRLLVTDNRRRALTRGALIGAGIGFGTCFAAGVYFADTFDRDRGESIQGSLLAGAVCLPGGAIYGLLGGAIAGRRNEYVFVDAAPEESVAPPEQDGEPDAADGDAQ